MSDRHDGDWKVYLVRGANQGNILNGYCDVTSGHPPETEIGMMVREKG